MKKLSSMFFFTKRIKIFFYSITLLLSLQSCEKDAEIKIPNVEAKIVISSFISPQDSIIQVAVSLSSPLYNNPNVSNEYIPLLGAIVTIDNGVNSYTLLYNPILKRYAIDSAQLKIIGGRTYHLSVLGSDGKHVNAVTTVPMLNNTLTYNVINSNLLDNKYTLSGTWSDNDVSSFNNYRFYVSYTTFSLFTGYNYTSGPFSDTIKTWTGTGILTDDTEGSVFQKELTFSYRTNAHDTVLTSLTSMSKEYIDYITKLNIAVGSFSGPFSEPVQMYTNISGGFGVFAGYNVYRKRIFP